MEERKGAESRKKFQVQAEGKRARKGREYTRERGRESVGKRANAEESLKLNIV